MKQSLLLWLSLLYGIGGYSQSVQSQVIGSAGDHFETNEAQMAFTIGEVVTETFGGRRSYPHSRFSPDQPDGDLH
jgi:hypothetical protein